jgi:hypothetical protein
MLDSEEVLTSLAFAGRSAHLINIIPIEGGWQVSLVATDLTSKVEIASELSLALWNLTCHFTDRKLDPSPITRVKRLSKVELKKATGADLLASLGL